MKTEEEVKKEIEQLETERTYQRNFLKNVYKDKVLERKINEHVWRVDRDIQLLNWVVDKGLPF